MTKISTDSAIERCGKLAMDKDELLNVIDESQNERFKDIRSLSFGWVSQEIDGETKKEKKLMTYLPNGKACFLDRSQNIENVIPEDPYICLVYERQREAFAKILSPEFQPHIYIQPTKIVTMVWRDEKGKVMSKMIHENLYENRIVKAIKEMESKGFEQIKVVFRKNIR